MIDETDNTMEMVMYTEEKKRINDIRMRPVVIHNSFVQGRRYADPFHNSKGKSWTKTERRIFLYLVASIKPSDQEFGLVEFDLRDFCRACGIGGKRPSDMYQTLKDNIQRLADRSDWMIKPDGKEKLVRIISDVELDQKVASKVRIQLHKDMMPYLLNMKDSYLLFPLESELLMQSRYGQVLHELLRSVAYKGQLHEFELNDFKERMDATNYTSMSTLKAKVIQPALRDINTYSSLSVDVRYKKTGRSITHIVFMVRDLAKSNNPDDQVEYEMRMERKEREYDEFDQMTLWPFYNSAEISDVAM